MYGELEPVDMLCSELMERAEYEKAKKSNAKKGFEKTVLIRAGREMIGTIETWAYAVTVGAHLGDMGDAMVAHVIGKFPAQYRSGVVQVIEL
jgi:hypothetical protein